MSKKYPSRREFVLTLHELGTISLMMYNLNICIDVIQHDLADFVVAVGYVGNSFSKQAISQIVDGCGSDAGIGDVLDDSEEVTVEKSL